MVDFTLWDIVRNLLLAARWTVALSLVAFVGGGLVAVTKGARGAVMYRRGVEMAWAVPPRVEAVDATGAGDAFVGALLAAVLNDSPTESIESTISRISSMTLCSPSATLGGSASPSRAVSIIVISWLPSPSCRSSRPATAR